MGFTRGEIQHRKGVFSSVKQKIFMREELNTDLKSEGDTIPTRAFFLVSFVTIHIVTFIV